MTKLTLLFHEDYNWKSIVKTTSTVRRHLKKGREAVVGRKLYGNEYFSNDIEDVIAEAFKSGRIPIFVIDADEKDEIIVEETVYKILWIFKHVYNPHFLTINVRDPDELIRLLESGEWTEEDVDSYMDSVWDHILNIAIDYEIVTYPWEELYLSGDGTLWGKHLSKGDSALFKFCDSESFSRSR